MGKECISYDSVYKNNECETVARNIMVILSRTGNTFRELSWEEYLSERIKDGGGNTHSNFAYSEDHYFSKVAKHCSTLSDVKRFSPAWK